MRMRVTGVLCSLTLAASMSAAAPAWSQEKVGVVTAAIGPVTVARVSMPPEPLRFKDDVFLRDRVTTGDNAMTRILLGGKVVVTARERSTLTITEVPGLSTIDLTSGRIAVAVDKTRMKAGERVDVRTPHAIAGVRGTVLIVEAASDTSTVTVLRGLVDVVRVDPATRQAVGPVTPVGREQTVTVRSNVLPAQPEAVSPARAQELSKEFTPPMKPVAAAAVMPVEAEVARAAETLNALLATDSNTSMITPGVLGAAASAGTTTDLTTSTTTLLGSPTLGTASSLLTTATTTTSLLTATTNTLATTTNALTTTSTLTAPLPPLPKKY